VNLEILLFESISDADTVQAYRETEYRVHGDKPLTVDKGCQELASAHKNHRIDCSAFITACNPFSQVFDSEISAKRHATLGHELSQRNFEYLEGTGQHPSNLWPSEVSYLVFGMPLDEAKTLGMRLEQNAIV
jgi:hypothetical protein